MARELHSFSLNATSSNNYLWIIIQLVCLKVKGHFVFLRINSYILAHYIYSTCKVMQFSRTVILGALCALLLLTVVTRAMPPIQCNPGYVDDVPPRIRKICIALSTLYDLGSAMENYVNDKAPVVHQGNILLDNGVKRQDADHVFLRFGKRSVSDKSSPYHEFLA